MLDERLQQVKELEEEILEEKTRCKSPANLRSTPSIELKFTTYGNALIYFSKRNIRNTLVKNLRNSLKVIT